MGGPKNATASAGSVCCFALRNICVRAGGRRGLLQGQDDPPRGRHWRRFGLRHQRPRTRAPHDQAYSGQSADHRAEPAGRRLADDDEPALQHRSVRRHRDGRDLQRPADHAAAATERRALRRAQDQLDRLDQPRDPGDVRLAHRAAADAGGPPHQGDDRRRAGRGLDAVRLSDARQRRARVEIQGHHRIRGDAENQSRDGARRGARHLGQLVDAEGDLPAMAGRQEDPHPRAMGAAQAPRDEQRAADLRRRQDRRAEAGIGSGAGATRVRPSVLPAAGRAAGAGGRNPQGVRRDDEGPGVHCRGGQAQNRHRSTERRGGRGAVAEDLQDACGHGRACQEVDGA